MEFLLAIKRHRKEVLFVGAALGLLAGCSTAGVSEFKSPDGVSVKTAKCVSSVQKCFGMASESCPNGGEYKVLSSESHAGGLVADYIPGPATWYSMTYICGKSDGQMPRFPFGGPEPAVSQYVPPPQPVTTQCTRIGNTTNCTSR